jgi:aspartyl-tRNA(Asn)/glutamyl-tRNA(Gln) amidotransferase subunit A
MSNHRRFVDWSSLTLRQKRAAASRAMAAAARLEGRLHAFVKLALPEKHSVSETGSLAFLPYAAKDLFFAPGHQPRCGLGATFELDGAGYADALRNLDQAGARRIGFTAMTELAYEPSGFNAVSDYPRNPWNCDFIPGGSSSGSAVAVASGASVLALGSDTGGSIRIPAHCCGVTGFKPSWGAISVTGSVPLAPFLDCLALLARSAADLAAAAEVLLSTAPPTAAIGKVVVFGDVLDAADPPIRRLCQDGIDLIRSLPIAVARVEAVSAISTIDAHALIVMQGEAARTHASRISHLALDPVLRKRLAKGLAIDDRTLAASRAMRAPLLENFEDKILGAADAAVLPVMPICTPRYVDVEPASPTFSGRRLYDLSRHCRFVNMLGLPAVALPVGFDECGLPVGLQLIGRRGRDRDLIALACRIQKNSNWHARVPDAIDDLVAIDEDVIDV